MLAQFFEVKPGAEHRIGPGHNDDVDGGIVLCSTQGPEESAAQRRGECIARGRPIQGERSDSASGVNEQDVGFVRIARAGGVRHSLTVSACGYAPIVEVMCRNITELRGLQPAATDDEIEAAARQYVRKVSGVTRPSGANAVAFEAAVAEVAASTQRLLAGLAPRRQPPKSVPPLRRPEINARVNMR